MTSIRAVTLDAAGTLISVAEPVSATYTSIAREHAIELEPQSIDRAFRNVFPDMPPLAFGNSARASLERAERGWWKTLVRGCVGPHGRHAAFDSFFDALYEHYRQASAWRLFPEVNDLLDELAARGVAVAVVSNFDTRLHDILEAHGVATRFRHIVCSSEAGAAKPDPAIFHHACELLAEPAASTLHVGDDRRADFEGARGAGLEAFWLHRDPVPASDRDPHRIAELTGLLKAL